MLYSGKKRSHPTTKMHQSRVTKSKMRKAFLLAALLENYIPEEVHISFHITNEGMRYFPNASPTPKNFLKVFMSLLKIQVKRLVQNCTVQYNYNARHIRNLKFSSGHIF